MTPEKIILVASLSGVLWPTADTKTKCPALLDDKFLKLCPINNVLVSQYDFRLQSVVHLEASGQASTKQEQIQSKVNFSTLV